MAWAVLFAAGLLEVGWAIGLKYTEGFTRLVPSALTLAAMAGSIVLLGLALKALPIGTAYAVWPASAPLARRSSASHCSANPLPPPGWRASG
jgi:multidrug transporter EmrE-like cation transporter